MSNAGFNTGFKVAEGMKTVADFKRRLKKGIKLECIFHQATTGHRDENGKLRLFDENRGVREVNIIQSNSFTLLTEKNGKIIDSWMTYPKATQVKFIDPDTIQILDFDFREHDSKTLIPLLTYKFV